MNRCDEITIGPADLIPLSHIALSAGLAVDELARRLHDRIVTNDAGIRCVTREHARAVLAGYARKRSA